MSRSNESAVLREALMTDQRTVTATTPRSSHSEGSPLNFLQPGWLLLLLAAIPVILLHMRRRHTVVVGSAAWQSVTATASRRHAQVATSAGRCCCSFSPCCYEPGPPNRVGYSPAPPTNCNRADNSVAMHATGDYDAAVAQLQELLDSGYENASVLLTAGEHSPVLFARRPAGSIDSWLPLLPTAPQAASADWQAVTRTLQGITDETEDTAVVVLAAPASTVPVTLSEPETQLQLFPAGEARAWLQDTRVLSTEEGRQLTGTAFIPDGVPRPGP